MLKKYLVLGIVSFFVLTGSLFAQTIVKDDFRVNDDFDIGGSNQRMPAIAMDHEGDFVIVWMDERNTFLDIYGQRFDRTGNPLGENFRVSNSPGRGKYIGYNMAVAIDGDGGFVVVWQDNRNNNSDIYAQKYDASGSPIGSNFKVNDDLGITDQFGPAISMSPSGEFAVIWMDNREGPHSIYGQRYSSSGKATGSNFKVVTVQHGPAFGTVIPAVAINPKGNFVTTWVAQTYNFETGRISLEIHAIRIGGKNEVLGSEFKVNDNDTLLFLNNPEVAMDASGNFVITWEEKRAESQDIYAQRYNFKGEALGSNFRVNEITGRFFKAFPKIAMNLSKKFIIAWIDSRDRIPSIYFQHYDQFGEPEGSNVKIAEISPSALGNFGITSTPAGYLALAWDGYRCKYDSDIFAMIIDQRGEVAKKEFGVEADVGSASQRYPAIASSPSDRFIISWDDTRFCARDVFAQRFSSSGDFLGSNFSVNQQTGKARNAGISSVSMDSSGNSVIAFTGSFGIYLQRYDFDGEKLGENLFINDNPLPFGVSGQDVAMDPKGDFVVVWPQMAVSTQHIYGQLFDFQGNKVDSNFNVNSFFDTSFYSDYPKVARCSSGEFVVVWQNIRRNIKNVEIWGQLFNSSGDRIGENFKIGDSAQNMGNYALDVGMDRDGNFVVAWSIEWNIQVQRFRTDGSKIGPMIKVIEPNKTRTYNLCLAVKPNGEFIVVWEDYRNSNQDIFAQRFGSEGNPLGGNFRVNSDQGDNTQMSPVVAADDKNYYFAWVDNRNLVSGFDIFAKIISFEPTFVSEPGASAKPEFSLLQNYPNPFNPTTTIPFSVSRSKTVAHGPIPTTLKIYNILGQKVRTLVDEDKLPGSYQVIWDGKDEGGKEVSSGVYFYVVKAQDLIQTRKMTLLR